MEGVEQREVEWEVDFVVQRNDEQEEHPIQVYEYQEVDETSCAMTQKESKRIEKDGASTDDGRESHVAMNSSS